MTETTHRKPLEKISHEELTELKGDLEKNRSSGDLVTVYKILKVLQSKMITRELLASTMIGKTISSLMQVQPAGPHAEDEAQQVRSLSSDIVEEWKKISKMEKKQATSGTTATTGANGSEKAEEKKVSKGDTKKE